MTSMKVFIAGLMCTISSALWAQTADDHVAQGRAALSISNLLSANDNFASAVSLSPNHQIANAFYGITRLLVLPSLPAGSNFLNRLGVPTAGRSIYHWTAFPPVDSNNMPIVPSGVNMAEAAAILRTNVLPTIIAAEANLAKVGDTNFTLSLSGSETATVAVTLDYGDIQLLRAMLQGAEYACYSGCSYNVDTLLSSVAALSGTNSASLQQFLLDHPAFLTFTTTNDLNAARVAMQNAANRYFEASQFIRGRSTNVVRLFNYAPEKADDEQIFRQAISDVTNSISQPVILSAYSNYTIFAGAQFNGTHEPRYFLPIIRGDAFGLGTFPDLSFGGLVQESIPGLVQDTVEKTFARRLTPVPTIRGTGVHSGSNFQFAVNTLKGRGYVVQVSANLVTWSNYLSFFSFSNSYAFVDLQAHDFARRYYRVSDKTDDMPPPQNDNFTNAIPLVGLGISAEGYDASASSETNEPGWSMIFDPPRSVWWKWTAPSSGQVEVLVFGQGTMAQVYGGTSLSNLTFLAYPGLPFAAIAGTTYYIQVFQALGGPGGGVRLVITSPPVISVHSPEDGLVSLTPTNLVISASATSPYAAISNLTVFADYQMLGVSYNSSLSLTWSNLQPGFHAITIACTDSLGATTSSNLSVTVRPPNDNFANAFPIIGSSAVVVGTNSGASKELGETNILDDPGGNSVWWTWTAPSSGPVTISADLLSQLGWEQSCLLAVYTGNSLSNLLEVASDASFLHSFRAPVQVSFSATAGVVYHIAVDGQYGETGHINLRITPTEPPVVSIVAPMDGDSFVGPTNVTMTVDAFDGDGTITRVDFYRNGQQIGSATNVPYAVTLSNLASGTQLSLVARATDNSGVSTYSDPVNIAIVFPPWTPTGSLLQGRAFHTATLLPDGKVLVAGGQASTDNVAVALSSAELYDPVTGTWSATGPMSESRNFHTATLLPDGKVLVAGGEWYDTNGNWFTLSSAEIFDPATGAWSTTGPLHVGRTFHTATLLPNGRVLVSGGEDSSGNPLGSVELYDPASKTWSLTGALNVGRALHTANLLPNGKVLVVGGFDGTNSISGTELFDPATSTWTVSGSLNTPRFYHTATLLANGKLLVVGGTYLNENYDILSDSESYLPSTGSWSIAGWLEERRAVHTAIALPDGDVLVAGGYNSGPEPVLAAELYHPAKPYWLAWSSTSALNVGRVWGHTANLLPNGKVLVAGGVTTTNDLFTSVATAELYTGPVPAAKPVQLAGLQTTSGGAIQFSFTNTPGTAFDVLTATNLGLPLSNWILLRGVPEVIPGQFRFTDVPTTNLSRRFYRVRLR